MRIGTEGLASVDPRLSRLTKRERELLRHVFHGRRTAEIAAIEGIAPQTVLNRLQEARGKLGGVDRRTAALMLAEAEGWTPGIKATGGGNTLFPAAAAGLDGGASSEEQRGVETPDGPQPEHAVFVETIPRQLPPTPPGRRNDHDVLARIGMLLARTALLVAATVALLWVYGRV